MTRPYELLARFAPDGSVAGVSVRTITTVNGRDFESDPSPLSGASDPAFTAFAAAFSASAVAQRDQLVTDKASLESQLASMTTERDGLQSKLATITAERDTLFVDLDDARRDIDRLMDDRSAANTMISEHVATIAARDATIAELEAQLDALLNPPTNPRHLAPFDFLALLKPEEIFALQTSVDPTVVVGRAKLQTIITFVDLDHQTTIDLVRYMEAAGLCEPGRADQILAGEPPT